MSDPSKSPLAQAFAALESAMANTSRAPASPERRRAAHRLGELVRAEDAELAAFARRHLPGREIDEGLLSRTREALLRYERLLALVGRNADAGVLLDDLGATLEARLPQLEADAAPAPKASLPSATRDAPRADVDAAPAMLEVPRVLPLPPAPAHPTAAALEPSPSPLGSLVPYEVQAPLVTYSTTPIVPPEYDAAFSAKAELRDDEDEDGDAPPLSHTVEEHGCETRLASEPLPFAAASTQRTGAMPVFAPRAERPHVLPFATTAGGAVKPPVPEDTAVPFRSSARNRLAPLPQHLLAMPLEDYVTYRVLLEVHPSRRTELDAHYRIEGQELADALSTHWQRTLAGDPAVRARWDELYPRTLAYYRRTP